MPPKSLTLRAIRPNAGLEALYRQKLERLVNEMAASCSYWLAVAYRNKPPELAQDAPQDLGIGAAARESRESSAKFLQRVVRRLVRRWERRFDEAAPELARYFATTAAQRTDGQLKAALKKAGFSVEFKLTAEANDVLQAAIAENVALIRSLPAQYLTQVEGSVMRSVQTGRDIGALAKDLREHHGVTKRRAAFISTDQNAKTTAVITRVRQQQLAVVEALWLHSHAGRHPRPTHVANSGKRYKIADGWFDPAVKKWIWPGTEPRCRCVARSIIPALDDGRYAVARKSR